MLFGAGVGYQLALALGASEQDLVPFEKYANAALSLGSPSSAARALFGGAPNIDSVRTARWKVENELQSLAVVERTAQRYGVDPQKMVATLKATAFRGDVSNEQLMALLEPIMIVVLGGLVGGMIIAMYMPIFKIFDLIRK